MPLSRRTFLAQTSLLTAASTLLPRTLHAQAGAPSGSPDAYAKPKPEVDGPFKPTWASIRDNHHTPAWFNQAKFGIFIHWGLYSIPARINEWYIKHMYTSDVAWHTEHYGPPDKFGYKDFIPLFTVPKYDPAAWAQLFKDAGAKYVVPVAEHHDGFAMWNSDITPWCAGKMGPKRDLTGELAAAVRKQNMIFGLSTHRMEHHTFAYPKEGLANDQFDPRYAGFYGPAYPRRHERWRRLASLPGGLARPRAGARRQIPARSSSTSTTASTRASMTPSSSAPLPTTSTPPPSGARKSPSALRTGPTSPAPCRTSKNNSAPPNGPTPTPGQSDDAIGSTWGYTESPKPMTIRTAASVPIELIEHASTGGNLMLNVSPMGDGSIPDNQQKVLLALGQWLKSNGEGIYDSPPLAHPGRRPRHTHRSPARLEGRLHRRPDHRHQGRPRHTPRNRNPITEASFRFTTANGHLYAFGYRYPAAEASLRSLSTSHAKVERVTLLGPSPMPLTFKQTADALIVTTMPPTPPTQGMPYTLRIEGTQGLGLA